MLAPSACSEPVERAMAEVAIAPSPNCVLTCLVSWTTTEEAFPAVEFGEGELQFRVEGHRLRQAFNINVTPEIYPFKIGLNHRYSVLARTGYRGIDSS